MRTDLTLPRQAPWLAGMSRRTRTPLPPGFGALWTTVALDLVGFGIVLPILPLYAHRYGATPFESTLLVAAFSAASFVFSPLWGRISDRVGRKPVLIVSLIGTAVGSLVTGLAGGLALLFVGRLLDGISGSSVSVAQAAVTDLAPPEERPRLFGLLGAAFGIGFVAGPAIGAIGAVIDPRLPFLIAAVIAGANAVAALRRLPSVRATAGRNQRPVRAGMLSLLRHPELTGLIGVAFLAMVAFSGFEATFALFGHRHLGFSLGSSAGAFAVIGAVIVVVQGGLIHPVVARLGEANTFRTGLVFNAVGLLLLAPARGWALAVPALLALTVGQGLAQPTITSTLAGRADPGRRGEVLGLAQSASGLARVVGPILGGALLGATASGLPYVVGGVLTVGALGLVGLAHRPAVPPVAPAPAPDPTTPA